MSSRDCAMQSLKLRIIEEFCDEASLLVSDWSCRSPPRGRRGPGDPTDAAHAWRFVYPGKYTLFSKASQTSPRQEGTSLSKTWNPKNNETDPWDTSGDPKTTITLGLGCGLALVAMLHRPIAGWTESSLWNPVSLVPSMLALRASPMARFARKFRAGGEKVGQCRYQSRKCHRRCNARVHLPQPLRDAQNIVG